MRHFAVAVVSCRDGDHLYDLLSMRHWYFFIRHSCLQTCKWAHDLQNCHPSCIDRTLLSLKVSMNFFDLYAKSSSLETEINYIHTTTILLYQLTWSRWSSGSSQIWPPAFLERFHPAFLRAKTWAWVSCSWVESSITLYQHSCSPLLFLPICNILKVKRKSSYFNGGRNYSFMWCFFHRTDRKEKRWRTYKARSKPSNAIYQISGVSDMVTFIAAICLHMPCSQEIRYNASCEGNGAASWVFLEISSPTLHFPILLLSNVIWYLFFIQVS